MRNIVEHGQISGSSETTVLSGVSSSSRLHEVDLGADGDGRRRPAPASTARMMKSVEPTWSASSHTSWRALGVDDDDAVGVLGPEGGDVLGPEALVDRAVALPQQEGGLLAVGLGQAAELEAGVPHPHVVVRVAHGQAGVAAEVLVGEEQHLLPPAPPSAGRNAHSSTARALVDVHTAPPWRPTNAFSAADEFM